MNHHSLTQALSLTQKHILHPRGFKAVSELHTPPVIKGPLRKRHGPTKLACLAPHLSLPNISKSCGYREHQRSLSTSSYSWKASSLISVFNYPLCVQIGMHWTEMSQVSTPVRAQQSSDAAKIQSIASERQAALKLVATSCVSPHLAGREGRSQHS